MWLLPSRERPDSVARFFKAFEETGATTPGVLWLDEDDDYDKYIALLGKIPANWQVIRRPRPESLGALCNEFFALFPNEPWYGLIADDMVPRTRGWDKQLIEAAGSDGLSYGDDCINGKAKATHPVIGGDLVRELGWIALPGLTRIYIDDALMESARRRSKLHYLPAVITEHLHFSTGKSPNDAVYAKPRAGEDKEIFDAWRKALPPETTFVCVNWGNYCGRGAEYVNNLYDMVGRNLPAGYSSRFICYTDSSDGLRDGIVSRQLPEGLKGWWNKLALFRAGEFEYSERVIYFDLDTVITGPLDELLEYNGQFALLSDFYFPERYANGMMIWRAGFGHGLWDDYVAAGFPTDMPLGDLTWTNQYLEKNNIQPDVLQLLYPGAIGSYKAHCQDGLPRGMRVVCFHGIPRPHEAGGWVDKVWKEGGACTDELPLSCNVSDAVLWENIRKNSAADMEWVQPEAPHDGVAVIVGGGPSLKYDLQGIRELSGRPATVFALNGALNYLVDHEIPVDASIVIDARESNLVFVERQMPVTYYLASQASPALFDHLADLDVRLFHIAIPGIMEFLKTLKRDAALVGGGRTVGLIGLVLAYTLGYREIHLYGYDSSYEEDMHHAYEQNAMGVPLEVEYEGGKFISSLAMINQAKDFEHIAAELVKRGAEIHVHGYGLLPWMASKMAA